MKKKMEKQTPFRIIRGIALLVFAISIYLPESVVARMRLSFLDEEDTLENTASLLLEYGCDEENVAAFKKQVKRYYKHNDLALSGYPPEHNGYFEFPSVREYLETDLQIARTDWPCYLNCMGLTLLLLNGEGLRADDILSDYVEGDAPEELQQAHSDIENIVYPLLREVDIAIDTNTFHGGVCLWRTRSVSSASSECIDSAEVTSALLRAWEREGLRRGTSMETLVVLGVVPREGRVQDKLTVQSYHYGVLLPHRDRIVLIEKNGLKWPFRRVDFTSERELAEYMIGGALLDPDHRNPRHRIYKNAFFVFRNDRLIGYYDPSKQMFSGEQASPVSATQQEKK